MMIRTGNCNSHLKYAIHMGESNTVKRKKDQKQGKARDGSVNILMNIMNK